jgi:hypothetical protein
MAEVITVWFAGRRVRESSKTGSKTLAKAAEQKRRPELEEGFNNLEDVRQERVRTIQELADEYSISYKLRHPRSATFAELPWATSSVCSGTKCWSISMRRR